MVFPMVKTFELDNPETRLSVTYEQFAKTYKNSPDPEVQYMAEALKKLYSLLKINLY